MLFKINVVLGVVIILAVIYEHLFDHGTYPNKIIDKVFDVIDDISEFIQEYVVKVFALLLSVNIIIIFMLWLHFADISSGANHDRQFIEALILRDTEIEGNGLSYDTQMFINRFNAACTVPYSDEGLKKWVGPFCPSFDSIEMFDISDYR